nr:MAG TPA: hypothetical protein [Caudoviricetes sp.]
MFVAKQIQIKEISENNAKQATMLRQFVLSS